MAPRVCWAGWGRRLTSTPPFPSRRYDKLKIAQADGKCTVGTVLQWYGKTHQLSDAALSLLDGMLAIDKASQSTPSRKWTPSIVNTFPK